MQHCDCSELCVRTHKLTSFELSALHSWIRSSSSKSSSTVKFSLLRIACEGRVCVHEQGTCCVPSPFAHATRTARESLARSRSTKTGGAVDRNRGRNATPFLTTQIGKSSSLKRILHVDQRANDTRTGSSRLRLGNDARKVIIVLSAHLYRREALECALPEHLYLTG